MKSAIKADIENKANAQASIAAEKKAQKIKTIDAKLTELRNGFKDLDKISDRGKLSAKLDAIVKIESEISEEHNTYHALK